MRVQRAAQVTTRDTQRLRLIRQRWSPARLPCELCDTQTQMLTPEEAAAFARTDVQEINSRIEHGSLHGQETAEGFRLICLNALL